MRIIFLVLFLFSVLLSANQKQKVLILHSYHKSYQWTDSIHEGIVSIIDDKVQDLELYIEYMDSKRYISNNHYKNLAQIYKDKYKDIKFDLIIGTDNNAVEFLKKYDAKIFKSAPVVFAGVNYMKDGEFDNYKNFTGVNEKADIKKGYELIKKLHPKVKNIYFITDTTTTGKRVKQEAKKVISDFNDDINYEIIDDISFYDLKNKVVSMPPHSAILLAFFFRGNDSKFFEYYAVPKMISVMSKTPLYGVWDFTLGNGIIGGYLTSGYFQGRKAAQMGLKVLSGEKIENIPIVKKSPNRYMFDFNQLQKYNIDEKLLPKDSYIINKKQTFYELHKNEIIAFIILLIFLILFIIILLINIDRRKKAQARLKKQLDFQQTLIDTVDAPVYYKNTKGYYQGCNKAFEEFIHTSKEELIGKRVYDILDKELADFYAQKDKEILEHGHSQKYEGIIKDRDNNSKNVILYKNVYFDEVGKIEGIVGVLFDITKLKKVEKKLQRTNDVLIAHKENLEKIVYQRTKELEDSNEELHITVKNLEDTQNKLTESEKMASLGGLVAGVAHEINTPVGISLTAITHLEELSKKVHQKYKNDEMTQEDFEDYLQQSDEIVKMIVNNIRNTSELIRSFKKISVDQTSEAKREFKIKEYMQDILLSINNFTKKQQHTINIDCDENLQINSYPGAFSQIFTNLIMNSFIHGFKNKKEGVVDIKFTKQDDKLKIDYYDNGSGIKDENISKIFDPFFTTNRAHGGTGLGLNIIYNIIISLLGGSIECVKQEDKKGVYFRIIIPLI